MVVVAAAVAVAVAVAAATVPRKLLALSRLSAVLSLTKLSYL